MGTTVEGDPDAIWAVARAAHEACIAAGAERVMTIIKVSQAADDTASSTIDGLTGKFRL